jgi:hypothetical protein
MSCKKVRRSDSVIVYNKLTPSFEEFPKEANPCSFPFLPVPEACGIFDATCRSGALPSVNNLWITLVQPLIQDPDSPLSAHEAWQRFVHQAHLLDPSGKLKEIWLSKLVPIALVDDRLTLRAPATFFAEYFMNKHRSLIDRALWEVLGDGAVLDIVRESPASSSQPEKLVLDGNLQSPLHPQQRNNLNPKYRFDNYIEGDSNRFALAAARSIAESPLTTPVQPLFRIRRQRLRQDPPDPGDRRLLHPPGHPQPGHLHHERAVHQPVHRVHQTQAHDGLRPELPQCGHADPGRHPVHHGQGTHTDRVLPHLQQPVPEPARRSSCPPTGPPRTWRTWTSASPAVSPPGWSRN